MDVPSLNAKHIVWRFISHRMLEAAISVAVLAVALAALTFVIEVKSQITARLLRDVSGVDMVVGAKGGSLQLVLSGIYLLDAPTGNVPREALDRLSSEPMVKDAIPLALGDNVQGFQIVGTDWRYVQRFDGVIEVGARWQAPMEVVLGADVARVTGYRVGASFVSNHGIGPGGSAHHEAPYRVAGVLGRTGSILDRVVVTSIQSVWTLHRPSLVLPDNHRADREDVTVILVKYATPLAAAFLPRQINEGTNWQAASPAMELTRLFGLVGVSSEILYLFGIVLVALAIATSFIAMHVVTRDRAFDLAVMRMLGAGPLKTMGLILLLALALGVLGILCGIFAGECAVWWMSRSLIETRSISVTWWTWPRELFLVPCVGLLSVLVAVALPALRVYRQDVLNVLQAD